MIREDKEGLIEAQSRTYLQIMILFSLLQARGTAAETMQLPLVAACQRIQMSSSDMPLLRSWAITTIPSAAALILSRKTY
jgi:hypothetical protein